jgi:hypothetical protein
MVTYLLYAHVLRAPAPCSEPKSKRSEQQLESSPIFKAVALKAQAKQYFKSSSFLLLFNKFTPSFIVLLKNPALLFFSFQCMVAEYFNLKI